ncbi:MAG: adenine phosphoribosyltransferase [Actinobacteria bacterium]|nr:adenine phosphoribosyltransferase [Actinomycetota bacterium]
MTDTERLRNLIREIPDFPRPGVGFKDITPLLADPVAFSTVVDLIVVHFGRGNIDKVCGIEARGFIVAAPVAYHCGAGFVPIRKAGKLPSESESEPYVLEYGEEILEIHRDGVLPGERVLIVDDVLATGGTAAAAVELVTRLGGKIEGVGCVIELEDLGGRSKLDGVEFFSLLRM